MTDTDAKTEMHALALRVAERIEAEAKAVRLLQDLDGLALHEVAQAAELSGDDVSAADVDAARALLELEEVPAYDEGGETFDVADGVEDWLDRSRFEGPLCCTKHGTNSGDGWEVDYVQIVLGTGGPHVEVQHHGNSAKVIAYHWFGEGRTELPVDADDVDLLYGVEYMLEDHG